MFPRRPVDDDHCKLMYVSEIMTPNVVCVHPRTRVDEAVATMDAEGVRHLPVIEAGRLVGVVSERDLLDATGWLPRRMLEVLEAPACDARDIMHSPVVTISPGDSLVTASMRLIEWGIGCLPVLNEVELVGMLTNVDMLNAYATACSAGGLGVRSDPELQALMSTDVAAANYATPADEALEFMRSKTIHHLPIMEGDKLVGILSERDLRMSAGRGQLEGTPIGDLAPNVLHAIEPAAKLSEAAQKMVALGIGALPILGAGRMLGLITSTDVLRHCIDAFAHGAEQANA